MTASISLFWIPSLGVPCSLLAQNLLWRPTWPHSELCLPLPQVLGLRAMSPRPVSLCSSPCALFTDFLVL